MKKHLQFNCPTFNFPSDKEYNLQIDLFNICRLIVNIYCDFDLCHKESSILALFFNSFKWEYIFKCRNYSISSIGSIVFQNSILNLISIACYALAQWWILSFLSHQNALYELGIYSFAISIVTPLVVFLSESSVHLYIRFSE